MHQLSLWYTQQTRRLTTGAAVPRWRPWIHEEVGKSHIFQQHKNKVAPNGVFCIHDEKSAPRHTTQPPVNQYFTQKNRQRVPVFYSFSVLPRLLLLNCWTTFDPPSPPRVEEAHQKAKRGILDYGFCNTSGLSCPHLAVEFRQSDKPWTKPNFTSQFRKSIRLRNRCLRFDCGWFSSKIQPASVPAEESTAQKIW